MHSFKVKFNTNPAFKVKFNTNPAFKVKFEPIGYDIVPDPYVGTYDVVPTFSQQTLHTNLGKQLQEQTEKRSTAASPQNHLPT